jgi:vacuolar-type H+-ATPase subunit H
MFKWLGKRPEKREQKTRQLWEREFKIVKEGLDGEQVVAFVNELIAQSKASQRASSASLRSILKTAVTDAEQLAASIKAKAQTEAEAEAATIITQANQKAQEIQRRAEVAAQKEVEDILSVANRKAEIAEVEAKQKALLFLIRARDEIEKEVSDEYKRAYSRLSSSLQDLLTEGQNIEMELKGRRAALWESRSFELKEYEAALLGTSEADVPPSEEGEVKPDMATEEVIEQSVQSQEKVAEENTEQSTQLQEEATEEVIEQPAQSQEKVTEENIEQSTQLQEEATEEVIEQPAQSQQKVTEENIEQSTQLQEEATEEVIEQSVQSQEKVTEENIEQPTRLQEEATVSETVEVATEELLEQPLPEERPGAGEPESAQLTLDGKSLYGGEVELIIAAPIELKAVSRFYNYLQAIPELRVLYTRGSWDRGTTITVVLDKPMPLINIISKTPGVEVTPELLEGDSSVKAKPGSLWKGGEKTVKGIKLILKEAQSR